MSQTAPSPIVGIIMGSQSDWETMSHAHETLHKLGVPHEVKIVSAHRTPDRMIDYAKTAKSRGLHVIIAGAGGAAHLKCTQSCRAPAKYLIHIIRCAFLRKGEITRRSMSAYYNNG